MTRKNPKKLDKIKSLFGEIDKTLTDRSDPYDQSKILDLETKMGENFIDSKKLPSKSFQDNSIKFKNLKKFKF